MPNLDNRSKALLFRIAEIVYQQQQLQRELIDLTIEFQQSHNSNLGPFTNETLEEKHESIYQYFCDFLVDLRNFIRSNSDQR